MGPPKELWSQFSDTVGISKAEFLRYFDGVESGCALHLSEVIALSESSSLNELRKAVAEFHPPQMYSKLKPGSRLLGHLLRQHSLDLGTALDS